jgi:hypothetical protein
MTLANAEELREVVSEPRGLARALARHAYGMRCWVDLIGARLALFEEPEAKALAARLVADNARHMLLFREQAAALGADPDAYRVPPEGEAIYDRLAELEDAREIAAFALGSLEHFGELLAAYRTAADPASAGVIDSVAADVDEHRAALRRLLGGDPGSLRLEAKRMYEARELVEVGSYAAG